MRKFLSIMLAALAVQCMAARAGDQREPSVSLGDVVRRAVSDDLGVRSLEMRQVESNARIDEIRHRDGWEFFIEPETRWWYGSRAQQRDTSQDRPERDLSGNIDELDLRLNAGLQRTFFGPSMDREADIALERLGQLDREDDLLQERRDAALDASLAYLDVVEANRLLAMMDRQIEYTGEVIHILRLREQEQEALEVEVLEVTYDLAQLEQRAARGIHLIERQLGYLRRILNQPALMPNDLIQPVIPGAATLEQASLNELVALALEQRPDLAAARAALDAATQFAQQYAKVLPDLDVELVVGYRKRDRDWADDLRDVRLGRVSFATELTVPLGIAPRNRARKARYTARAQSRHYALLERRQRVEQRVRQAYEAYQLALAERDTQERRMAFAAEARRVIQRQAEQLPELLTESPELAIYRARARELEAQTERQRAERERLSALLMLSAETHLLLANIEP